MGYHPLYMLARGIRHVASRPYVIGGLAMLATFMEDGLRGREQLLDPAVIRYIRRTQLRRLAGLLVGKRIYQS